jgi:hypothetical protein
MGKQGRRSRRRRKKEEEEEEKREDDSREMKNVPRWRKSLTLFISRMRSCVCRWILLYEDRRANLIIAIYTSFILIFSSLLFSFLLNISINTLEQIIIPTKLPSILFPLIMMNEATLVTSNDWTIKANLTSYNQLIYHDQLSQPTRQATFVGAILAFVFIFVGLIGNILLITTILSVKKLRSNIINIFIVSVRFDRSIFRSLE